MDQDDKQKLINLASKMFCVECGNREHEYTTTTLDNVPNVPAFRCKACNAISYPSFAYSYIDDYKQNLKP